MSVDFSGTAGRASRVRFLVLGWVCGLALITYLQRVGFASASSAIRDDLSLSERQLGDLMAAFMIAYGLFEVPWGAWGDRRGPRSILPVVIVGGSAATLCVMFVGRFDSGSSGLGAAFLLLLLLRFLFGAFQAGTFPSISRVLTDWMPATERGGAQGALWMSARLGGALAPLAIVPLIGERGGYGRALLVVSLVGFVWGAAFFAWYRNRPADMPGVNSAELELIERGRPKKRAQHGPIPWRRMLRSPSVWAVCLMYGCLGYSGNFYITLLPDYLRTHRHLDPETIKWLTTIPFALGVGACLLGGAASDHIIRMTGSRRWGRRIVGLSGMALAALTMATIPFLGNVYGLGAVLGLTFLANDLAMGPAWAAVADQGEEFAGTLGGLMNMTASFTGALGAVVSSRMFQAGEQVLPFQVYALVYLLGVVCWLFVDASRTLSAPSDPDL